MSVPKTSKIRQDPIPKVRAAGQIIVGGDDHSWMNHNSDGNPGTPEHIKKYRKSFQNQPGVKQIHPNQIGDQFKMGHPNGYGKMSHGSEHVDQVIKAQNMVGLADKFNDIKEAKYASSKNEPLAQGF